MGDRDNKEIIFKGLNILTPILANFLYHTLIDKYKDNWWREGVLHKLTDKHKIDLPSTGNDTLLLGKLDIDKLTILIANVHWDLFINSSLPTKFRTYIRELRDIRNEYVAHTGSEPIDNRDLHRAIDTMIRILEMVDQKNLAIGKLESLLDESEKHVFNKDDTELTTTYATKDEVDALNLILEGNNAGYKRLSDIAMNGSLRAHFFLSGTRGFRELEEDEMMWFVKVPAEIIHLLAKNFVSLDTNLKMKLGYIYYHGAGVLRDFMKALNIFLPLAESGNKKAQIEVGYIAYLWNYSEHVNLEKVNHWIFQQVENEDPEAQYLLSYMYELGKGVPEDEWKALELLEKAAYQGLAKAQDTLGDRDFYYDEDESEIDIHTAVKWYTKAASQGNNNSLCRLGYIYLWGDAGEKDERKAMDLLRKAAALGNEEAHLLIAGMYHMGVGVPFDYQKAKEWYVKSIMIFDSIEGKENLERLEKGRKLDDW